MIFEHVYEMLQGESYTIKTIPFEAISSETHPFPGLYSWHIRPKRGREKEILPLVDALISQTTLTATVQGNIRFKYSGSLAKEINICRDIDSSLLRSGFMLAQFPLYIGISINLEKRLATHYNQLLSGTTTHGDDESDYERSGNFAERITATFAHAKVTSLNSLFVRVLEIREHGETDTISKIQQKEIRASLEKVETVLNTVFNPVFGRK